MASAFESTAFQATAFEANAGASGAFESTAFESTAFATAAGGVAFFDAVLARTTRRRASAHLRPSTFGRLDSPPVPAIAAMLTVSPDRDPRRTRRAHRRPSVFAPALAISDGAVVPSTPPGAATFAVDVEASARVTLSWRTDVLKSWSGKEQRIALLDRPLLRLEFSSFLTDEQHRRVLAQLAGISANASIVQLALPYEEISIVAAAGTGVDVASLVHCDWAVPGQRVAIVAPDGASATAVIRSAAGTSIELDTNATPIARPGARIMPTIPVYLEPDQDLARYPINLGIWDLRARAAAFRYGTSDTAGAGAVLVTHDGLAVWDVGIQTFDASQPLHSGAVLADLGLATRSIGSFASPDWGRAIAIESSSRAMWQWFKLFLHSVRGRHRSFLLPSGRPDLVPVGDASTGTLVVQSTTYATHWFASTAHRRLALYRTDGTVAYRTVLSAVDNGNGTQDLALSAALAGALSRVEFLEQVRLESDDVTVTWASWQFRCDMVAKVVQQ